MYRKFGKRVFDLFFSTILLIVFIPLWIVIPILIKINSPGGIVFKQRRVGIDSTYFTIYKFRTMKEGTPDIPTDELTKEEQEKFNTTVGKFLRRFSLDEIPQLINIFRGDMSFVGPRPALYNQPLLIKLRKEKGIDKIRPGVTGLAQISGRDSLTIPEKVEYDYQYLKTLSFANDIKIILGTIKAVLTGKGAN
ncbi:MAG: sugar transferase [Actinobacteria bacterium]|nr:sugar transferase [Actinomycetota bacterium]